MGCKLHYKSIGILFIIIKQLFFLFNYGDQREKKEFLKFLV